MVKKITDTKKVAPEELPENQDVFVPELREEETPEEETPDSLLIDPVETVYHDLSNAKPFSSAG